MSNPKHLVKYNLALVREDMADLGLSGLALAQKCGGSRSAVTEFLRGARASRPSTVKRIADALGYPVSRYLLRRQSQAAAPPPSDVEPRRESSADPPRAAQV